MTEQEFRNLSIGDYAKAYGASTRVGIQDAKFVGGQWRVTFFDPLVGKIDLTTDDCETLQRT